MSIKYIYSYMHVNIYKYICTKLPTYSIASSCLSVATMDMTRHV